MALNLNNNANPAGLANPLLDTLLEATAIFTGITGVALLLSHGVCNGASYARKMISHTAGQSTKLKDETTSKLKDETTVPPIIECMILETPQRPVDIILGGERPNIKERISMTWPKIPAAYWEYPSVICFTKNTLEYQAMPPTGLDKGSLLTGLVLMLLPLLTCVLFYKIRGWPERRRLLWRSSAKDGDLRHKILVVSVTPRHTPESKELVNVTLTLAASSEEQVDPDVDVVMSETQEETEQPNTVTTEQKQVKRKLSDIKLILWY